VLHVYRDVMAAAPPELGALFGYRVMPSSSFVPERLHGQTACVIVACWTGPLERAERAVRPIRAAGKIALDLMGPMPYPALTGLFDALFPPGLHHYWKADFVRELSDEAIAIHAEHGARVPSDRSLMQIFPLDGAVHEISADATAFSYRDVRFAHVISGVDTDSAAMPARTTWVRDYWAALHPHSAGGAYVNFLMEEGQERVKATYRGNYPRLVEIKQRWDHPPEGARASDALPSAGERRSDTESTRKVMVDPAVGYPPPAIDECLPSIAQLLLPKYCRPRPSSRRSPSPDRSSPTDPARDSPHSPPAPT
jgi:hypothetical protein